MRTMLARIATSCSSTTTRSWTMYVTTIQSTHSSSPASSLASCHTSDITHCGRYAVHLDDPLRRHGPVRSVSMEAVPARVDAGHVSELIGPRVPG